MDSEVHWLLTRSLNPLIQRLSKVDEGDEQKRFRTQLDRGTVRYSRGGDRGTKLTRWLVSIRERIGDEYTDGPVSEVLDLLDDAFEATFRYAYLAGNDEAGQILVKEVERIDEKYDVDFRDRLKEISDTQEVDISTDLETSASDVAITIRYDGQYSYNVMSFNGERMVPLPPGRYEIIAEYDGVRDRETVTVESTTETVELALREQLQEEQESEYDPDVSDLTDDAEEEDSQSKGYTHPVMRSGPARTSQTRETEDVGEDGGGASGEQAEDIDGAEVDEKIAVIQRVTDAGKRIQKHLRRRKRRWRWRTRRIRRRSMWFLNQVLRVMKVSVILLFIGGIFLLYGSPSARTHLMNGNPAGILHDASDVASEFSTVLPEVNASHLESDQFDEQEVEREIHQRINAIRAERGLDQLQFDAELAAIARSHSADMATSGYFSHTAPDGDGFTDRYADAGYDCELRANGYIYSGAENIAKSYYETPIEGGLYFSDEEELAAGFVEQWMTSEGHRENILTPYWEREGIGVVMGEDDAVYATQNFC